MKPGDFHFFWGKKVQELAGVPEPWYNAAPLTSSQGRRHEKQPDVRRSSLLRLAFDGGRILENWVNIS